MRRKLSAIIGLGLLGVLLGSALRADAPTRDARGVYELQQKAIDYA